MNRVQGIMPINVAEATPKVIEKMLITICEQSGLDKKIVTCFIVTGGLHYTFEKVAEKLYLLKEIDPEIHLLMRQINLGFERDKQFYNLYEANEALGKIKRESKWDWEIERKTKEVNALREEFQKKAKKL